MTQTNPKRRVRRWDEPQPLDPNPERPGRDPGVCQAHNPTQPHDWEFMNGLPTADSVVEPVTPELAQVITLHPQTSTGRHPFAANNPTAVQRRAPRLTWWAVAMSVVAQATVTAAIQLGDANPVAAAAVSMAVLVCSLLLIAAEQITGRSNP